MKLNILKKQQKQTKNNKEKSRGRSMVEMLGVLAIIGVLSIGGISGYTIAMRKHRTNEIANLMTKYAFVLYQGFQNKVMNDPNFAELEDWTELGNPHNFGSFSRMYNCQGNDTYKWRDYCLGSLSFKASGLGALPNGIDNIFPYVIAIDKYGNTVVTLKVEFKTGSKEICQQVNQLLGDQYQSDYTDDSCPWNYLINGIVVDVNNAGNSYNDDSSYSGDW